jgi:hypothetical protein
VATPPSDGRRSVLHVEGALVALGFAIGGLMYLAAAFWLLGLAKVAVTGLLRLYWQHRSRSEAVAAVRRVAAANTPPARPRSRRAA